MGGDRFLLQPLTITVLRSYGYDPLSLGKDPAALQKYQVNEVLHARWAMLAAAGIIIPEGLQVWCELL